MQTLIERGSNINATYAFDVPEFASPPVNPLCAAAGEGHLEVVKVLCNWASQKEIRLAYKHHALISACRNSHAEVVKYLVSKLQIDINALDPLHGTPLYAARHQLAVTEVLLKRGAEANVVLYDGSTFLLNAIALTSGKRFKMVALLLHYGADANLTHATTGETPLMRAALAEHYDVVDLLLGLGADAIQVNHDGLNVLEMLSDDKFMNAA